MTKKVEPEHVGGGVKTLARTPAARVQGRLDPSLSSPVIQLPIGDPRNLVGIDSRNGCGRSGIADYAIGPWCSHGLITQKLVRVVKSNVRVERPRHSLRRSASSGAANRGSQSGRS